MRTKETTLATLPRDGQHGAPVQLATIVSLGDDGTPSVNLGAAGIIRARLAVRISRRRLESAIAQHQQCVLLFENNDPEKPLIIGFVEVPETRGPSTADAPTTASADQYIEADVDGRRLTITAQDEIVLQCGNASITLRRNGRVLIRGTYVETRSDGTNRIKGGQVQIN